MEMGGWIGMTWLCHAFDWKLSTALVMGHEGAAQNDMKEKRVMRGKVNGLKDDGQRMSDVRAKDE